VDLLAGITRGEKFKVPATAVVIGGGNVAMDIARSLARLQVKKYGEVRVTVVAMEARENFLADPDEVRAQLAAAGLETIRVEPTSDRHWIAWGELRSSSSEKPRRS